MISVTNYYPNSLAQFVATVKENKDFFTKKYIERAHSTRKLQEYIGWPSTQAFKSYINKNLLLNCSTTVDNVDRSIMIYGALRTILQGKTIQKDATASQEHVQVPLTPQIAENYVNVQLYIDLFYVNKTPFLHTKSRHLFS